MLAAFAGGTHTITADHARAAVSDTQIVVTRRESPKRLALVAAAGAVAGLVIGFAGGRLTATTPATVVGASTPMPAAVASVPAASPAAPKAPPPEMPAAPVAIPVAAVGAPDPVAARLGAGRELLANGGSQFAVQLMVTDARERAYLGAYLAEATQALPSTKLFLAEAGTPESPRYEVLYGPFRAKGEAVDALNALPAGLRQFGPYVRTLESVREDGRRATRR